MSKIVLSLQVYPLLLRHLIFTRPPWKTLPFSSFKIQLQWHLLWQSSLDRLPPRVLSRPYPVSRHVADVFSPVAADCQFPSLNDQPGLKEGKEQLARPTSGLIQFLKQDCFQLISTEMWNTGFQWSYKLYTFCTNLRNITQSRCFNCPGKVVHALVSGDRERKITDMRPSLD